MFHCYKVEIIGGGGGGLIGLNGGGTISGGGGTSTAGGKGGVGEIPYSSQVGYRGILGACGNAHVYYGSGGGGGGGFYGGSGSSTGFWVLGAGGGNIRHELYLPPILFKVYLFKFVRWI